jgi:para-aminobenzoate synthetase component 2
MQILLVDNEDSFTANLLHQIVNVTGHEPVVAPYHLLNEIDTDLYDMFVISAGPGSPAEYPDYDRIFRSGKPILGVCLGMQIMNLYHGGSVSPLTGAKHGICRDVVIDGEAYTCAVYNSLYCSDVADCFDTFAMSGGIPMGIKHRELPVAGVQFHPESFMTLEGDKILKYVFNCIGIN